MSKTIDIINDLDRYIAQAKSLSLALSIQDDIAPLNPKDTTNCLWLLSDQIDRIKAKLKDLWAEIKEVV